MKLVEDWETHENAQAVSWFELFTDLIFVAVIIKMSDMFKYTWFGENGTGFDNSDPLQVIELLWETFTFHCGFFAMWLEMTTVFTRYFFYFFCFHFFFFFRFLNVNKCDFANKKKHKTQNTK